MGESITFIIFSCNKKILGEKILCFFCKFFVLFFVSFLMIDITLYVQSPGGHVTAGLAIYDTMQMISSPVSTVCMGLAASMGSILLSAGEKGKRLIWPSGKVMIHQPSIGTIQGPASDLEIRAREILKTKEMGARVLAANCGQTIEKIKEDFDRDYWMNANESIEYGIVDKIVTKDSFSA